MIIDTDLLNQLKDLFKNLGAKISLVIEKSEHLQQQELINFLEEVSSTSEHISLKYSNNPVPVPKFSISLDEKPTGICFEGIPSGHEFSSLVLAILNSAGQGKLPDPGLTQRIKRLKGPIEIKTYISLTCENCPDVVQALNQITLIHGNMIHTMVDSAFYQDDLERLKIQGVPSVLIDNKLIHAGRANLLDLIAKLEANLSVLTSEKQKVDLGFFDVTVIGGGPAGVAAAIYSVRKGLKTALIAEKIGGQVQETKGIENLISVVYTEGPLLSVNFDKHLRSYPIDILEHRKVEKTTSDNSRSIHFDSGEHLQSETLIVATGAKWRTLGIPGEKEYIGRGVAFCPHCDGPYYKGKKVAVIGGGNSGVEAAIDLAGICQEVTLLEFQSALKADAVLVKKLESLANVKVIVNAKTSEIVGNNEKVTALGYQNRQNTESFQIPLDGVFVQIGLMPNSEVVKGLVETNSFGEIIVDHKGRTSAKGIYAAGDVTTTPYKQIVIAMGEGAKAALAAFEDRMRS